ncbi:MAG: Cupredoxin-like protein [Acidimicrobiales bacterium]|nr:Cupredoxin-like protein [Acidimicrobiales bacterium]
MRVLKWSTVVGVVAVAAWAFPLQGAGGATTTVHIASLAYSPASITVTVGGSVTWVNDDPIEHSVTANDGSFDSSPSCPGTCMGPGATFTFTFTRAGTFPYHCRIHGLAMSGTVTVQAPATSTTVTTPTTVTTSPPTTGGSGSTTTVTTAPAGPRTTALPGTSTPASPAPAVAGVARLTG